MEYAVRGSIFTGTVIKQKSAKTAVVAREISRTVPKYERLTKRTAKLAVHIPDNVSVNVGDLVKVGETRKISKTKNFVIMEVVKKGE